MFAHIGQFFKQRAFYLRQGFSALILAAFMYTFMEWIFIVTQSSFMDVFHFGEKVKILIISSWLVCLAALLSLPVLVLLDWALSLFVPGVRRFLYFLPAGLILTSLCLILLDNFTYTLFKFGIVSTDLWMRALYGAAFAAGFVFLVRKLTIAAKDRAESKPQPVTFQAAMVFFFLATLLAGFTYQPGSGSHEVKPQNSGRIKRPNIILLNSDGVNAANMSVYGYERDTTPFMEELAVRSLVGQNNFSNASSSRGSETAALTGKLPLFTRVLIVSNTLQDANQYEHLPGLLKRVGYKTISLGVKSYVDVNSINFTNAFDEVNCAANLDIPLSGLAFDDEMYFLSSMGARIQDRLMHIFFLQSMQNAFEEVTNAINSDISDQERLDCLYNYLDEAAQTRQPVFAHIHLMGTHGPEFYPESEVYSRDLEQDGQWMTDFYDDSILDFDHQVNDLVSYLKKNGLYDNTILVIYTDHGQKWSTTTRTPLIIHFPKDENAGWITENTQNIDIAPTLLDYLNLQKPKWMTGGSLLNPIDLHRLIIATRAVRNEDSSNNVITDEAKEPPFYQFGSVSIVQCQKITIFDLQNSVVRTGTVSDYPNPCPVDTLDRPEVLHGALGKVLLKAGFDLPRVW